MRDEASYTSASAAAPVPLAKVAYEVAVRSLSIQESTLNDLRARTGTLLAAGALAASFLGGRALDKVGFDAASTAGLAFFLASLALAGGILLPGEAMTFSGSGRELYESAFDDPEEEIYRRLVYWTEELLAANDLPLGRLALWFKCSVIALFAAITLWATAIATATA